jgi:hypothetical protein
MNQYSTFTFSVQFTNGFGGSGVNSFIIKTSGVDGLSLVMTQMDSSLFNIWENIIFSAVVNHFTCASGTV